MKQKSENQKAFPRFLGILVVASLIGGVLGGLSGVAGYFWKDHTAFGAAFAHLLGAASPWAMVACAAVLLGLGLYQYRKSDTAFHGWDGEDEDVMQRAEERLSWALLLDSLTVIVSFFFFNAGTAKLPQSSDGNTITLLVIFLVVIALATLLQQKTVDLTKKMNPEKRGSVYDMKFQERWWESCDEAERRQIGQASYKAYVTVSRFCPYCWGVLLLGNMVFHYGILPSAVVLVIWAVLSVSYIPGRPSAWAAGARKRNKRTKRKGRLCGLSFCGSCTLIYFFLLSHLVTHREQAMSPVTFRQVRPMSNRRSTATIRPM